MKNKKPFLLAAVFVMAFCGFLLNLTSTQASSAKMDGGRVTSAEIHPVNKVTTGRCPAKIEFTGRITTDGPAIVKYRTVQDDVGHIRSESAERTLVFREGGTHSVSYNLTPTQSMNSWVALHITAPNELETPHENGAFVLKCQQ